MLKVLPIYAAVAAFLLVAERLTPARPQPIFRRGLLTDGLYMVINILLRILFNSFLAIQLTQIGQRHLPSYSIGILLEQPLWLQTVAVILVLDFFFYVTHRLKHRWGWWWRLHETHHSSRDMDWFSGVRFHPLERALDRLIFLCPLLVLGASEEALFTLAVVEGSLTAFHHSNLNWRIGPLIYVFIGPEMHRWHHVVDPARRECNYGNILSIFDWMFGTAYITRENPTEFGLTDKNYPEGNFLKQFAYAFRSSPR